MARGRASKVCARAFRAFSDYVRGATCPFDVKKVSGPGGDRYIEHEPKLSTVRKTGFPLRHPKKTKKKGT